MSRGLRGVRLVWAAGASSGVASGVSAAGPGSAGSAASAFFPSFPLIPGAAHAVPQVDAIGEHGQRGGFEAQLAVLRVAGLGPAVGSAFEPFRVYPQARSIPVEQLEQVAGSVGEDEDRTAAGIVTETVDHLGVETVEGFAHVAGFGREEDPQAARKCQHGR